MKKKDREVKFLIKIFAIICLFGIPGFKVLASTGPVMVHYLGTSREPTYTYTKTHAETMGYTVTGHDNWDNALILNHLDNNKILVMHLHGDPGRQLMYNNTYLSGTNGNGGTIKAVSSMASSSTSQMKIAIYYGCSTGITSSSYGDLAQQTVNKGAQAAVAWKVTTYVNEVNEWNRLFFEHAISSNIVESYRHADYWLRYIQGNTAGDRMQLNRTERGNVYGYIN